MKLPPRETAPPISFVSKEEFNAGRQRRFGQGNGEWMPVAFWEMMVRWGASPQEARRVYGSSFSFKNSPVWSNSRRGASHTFFDGFVIQIGGVEGHHDDLHDPDFMIYNDVIVRDLLGGVWIFGYPRDDFRPTDFHTATLIGDEILVIGSLGYDEDREWWTTPVYRLSLLDRSIQKFETEGASPGWISKHQAGLAQNQRIWITGGQILQQDGTFKENDATFLLNLDTRRWTRIEFQ